MRKAENNPASTHFSKFGRKYLCAFVYNFLSYVQQQLREISSFYLNLYKTCAFIENNIPLIKISRFFYAPRMDFSNSE